MARHTYHRRLLKEYASLSKAKLPGITIVQNSENLTDFIFRLVIDNDLYRDQQFYVRIEITLEYPIDSPQVKFIIHQEFDDNDVIVVEDEPPRATVIPLHPHIYSNGHICLNLLGEDWSPACSLESIILSIQSMLNTNDKAERPPDDDNYVRHAPQNPKDTRFVYHDDDV